MYRDQRVMTLAMIDEWLGLPEGTVENTFKENRKRFFVRGDYYLVTYQDRKAVESYGVSVPRRGLVVMKEAGFNKLIAFFGKSITVGRPAPSWDPVFTVSPALRLVGGLDAPDDTDSTAADDGEPSVTNIQIADTEIPLVTYEGKRVVTFAMIDQVHQRPKNTAKARFHNHRKRFSQGEHFYVIDYKERYILSTLGIDVPNRGLTVLTEKGYLKLVSELRDTHAQTCAELQRLRATVNIIDDIVSSYSVPRDAKALGIDTLKKTLQ